MEVISVILMFMFGNMNDQEHQMTQYIPMESISSCMKEVRLLKKKQTDYTKDAFCGPGIVEIKDGESVPPPTKERVEELDNVLRLAGI